MEHKELALLYSPDSGPEGPVQAVLAEMEISWRRVLCGELGQPVGALAGLNAPEEEVPSWSPFPGVPWSFAASPSSGCGKRCAA